MGAAGERELVDQRSALIPAHDVKVVAASASGAHEVQPEVVDVGLDLVESGERDVAADALEHEAGVRPNGDGEATADHLPVEGLKRASAINEPARSRAARANHQGEGAWE